LANNGKICTPHLSISASAGCEDLNLKKEYLDQVRSGMNKACSSGGTAFPFFDFFDKSKIEIACKTGTAQNVNKDPHAWFVAYGPKDKPEIIVTVLIESGGEGSEIAAPIAREIFNYYFKVPNSSTPTPKSNN
jgi:penicillin-binding protein 2